MDYYAKMKAYNKEVNDIVHIPENFNKKFFIPNLELKYGEKYGFGRKKILKPFEIYAKLGLVIIDGDFLTILEKKS
jgi:hypothetical protein